MYLVGIYSHRFEFVKLLGKKSLDPDPDPDPYWDLDPDPDPYSKKFVDPDPY